MTGAPNSGKFKLNENTKGWWYKFQDKHAHFLSNKYVQI